MINKELTEMYSMHYKINEVYFLDDTKNDVVEEYISTRTRYLTRIDFNLSTILTTTAHVRIPNLF